MLLFYACGIASSKAYTAQPFMGMECIERTEWGF